MSPLRKAPPSYGLLLALVLVPALARTGAATREGARLKLSATALDFGSQTRGESVRTQVRLENEGDQDLVVRRLGADCGCATLRLTMPGRLNVPIDTRNEGAVDLVLKPGQYADLTVVVDTSKLAAGPLQKQCMILASDRTEPHVIPFSVVVEEPAAPPPTPRPELAPAATDVIPAGPHPRVEVEPLTIDAGEVLRGEDVSGIFTVRNKGEADLLIRDLRPTCSCVASRMWIGDQEFGKDEITARIQAHNLATLPVGGEARFEVTIQTAELPITTDHQKLHKGLHLFTNDPLQQTVALNLETTVSPAFELAPQLLRLPAARRGEAAELVATLSSTKIEGYALKSVSVGNAEALEVSFRETAGGTRPTYEILVKLSPTAPIGRVADQLVLQFDHARVQQLKVPVFGEVQAQVVFHGNGPVGTDRLNFGVLDGSTDGVVEMRIENRQPAVPYVPETIELTSRHGDVFRHELVEVKKGEEYLLRLTASKDIPDRYFNGRVRIVSQHPDLPVKLIEFRGWVDRAKATTPAAAQDRDQGAPQADPRKQGKSDGS